MRNRFFSVAAAASLCGSVMLLPQAGAEATASPQDPQLTDKPVALPMGCGDHSVAVWGAVGGQWTGTFHGQCGHIATQHNPEIYLSYENVGNSQGCVLARGYRWRDGKPYWTSLGCNGGGGWVHWGKTGHEIIATTAYKGKSLTIVTGASMLATD